jgi:hypothetical protein
MERTAVWRPLTPTGAVEWVVAFGGRGRDAVTSMAVDRDGAVYVSTWTSPSITQDGGWGPWDERGGRVFRIVGTGK